VTVTDPIALALARARFERFETQWAQASRGESGSPAGSSFGAMLTDAINRISEMQDRASAVATAFVRGDDVELHQVMAAADEAGVALELLVELRNKVLDAYHTLVSMQG